MQALSGFIGFKGCVGGTPSQRWNFRAQPGLCRWNWRARVHKRQAECVV